MFPFTSKSLLPPCSCKLFVQGLPLLLLALGLLFSEAEIGTVAFNLGDVFFAALSDVLPYPLLILGDSGSSLFYLEV